MTELQAREQGRDVTVVIGVDTAQFREAMRGAAVSLRRLNNAVHPFVVAFLRGPALREHRKRCRLCPDVPGYPRPLRVDGHDYRRRMKARRRRNRR